jgi:hypothetical protein
LRTTPLYAPDVPFGPEGWRKVPAIGRVSLLALPGTYTVTLTVGDEKFTQKVNVLKDPHSAGSESDIQTQTRVQTALFDEMNATAATVNQIESLRARLVALGKELGSDEASKPARKSADELGEKLSGIEGTLLQLKLTGRGQDDCRWAPMLVQKVDYLFHQLDASADFPPTTQQAAVQEELKQRGDKAAADFQQVVGKELAAFNGMLREHNIGNIYLMTP